MRHEGAWWYHAELKTQMGFAHWNVSYILFAPQRDAANRRRDAPPHFLFETSKRKCAVHGGKEKMSGMS